MISPGNPDPLNRDLRPVQDFSYAQANRTSLLLLGISLIALILLYARRSNVRGNHA